MLFIRIFKKHSSRKQFQRKITAFIFGRIQMLVSKINHGMPCQGEDYPQLPQVVAEKQIFPNCVSGHPLNGHHAPGYRGRSNFKAGLKPTTLNTRCFHSAAEAVSRKLTTDPRRPIPLRYQQVRKTNCGTISDGPSILSRVNHNKRNFGEFCVALPFRATLQLTGV